MLALNPLHNGARIIFPKEFLHPIVEEKYSIILKNKHSFFRRPIDFINETIQKVDVLGFTNASLPQMQTNWPKQYSDPDGQEHDKHNFIHPQTDYNYRSEVTPIALIDKTLNIEFRHTLGYLNYIMLFENFWYLYRRDEPYDKLVKQFNIDLFDENGVIFCQIQIDDPIINGMDMLSFDCTQPVTSPATFKIEFKYSNFDFEFPDRYLEPNETMPVNDSQIIVDEC